MEGTVRKLVSPTRHVPGDLLDKMSSFRWQLSGLIGRKMYFFDHKIQKYGPLVEIAPGKLACSQSEAIKTIYGTNRWVKSSFYSDFGDFQGIPTMFSERKHQRAAMLRRCFLSAFSRANLVAMSARLSKHPNVLTAKFDELDARNEPADAYRWFRYLTFRIITDIGFGVQYDMVSTGAFKHAFFDDFDDSVSWGIMTAVVGRWLDYVPLPANLAMWRNAAQRVDQHAQEALDQWHAPKRAGHTSYRIDILQNMISHGESDPEDKLNDSELRTEMMEIMLAGGDTTATTLTYGCYELSKHPKVQRKLRAALQEAIPQHEEVTLKALEAVPCLDSTIKEMMRLHPSLGSSLERVVPPQSAKLCGLHLSPGTVVCMQAYTQHKLTDIFPDPTAFAPERWEHESTDMKTNFIPFSTGPRSCVGQNLAIMQMKVHIGTLLRRYSIEAHEKTTSHSMEPLDFFQWKPRSGRCLLHFKREDVA